MNKGKSSHHAYTCLLLSILLFPQIISAFALENNSTLSIKGLSAGLLMKHVYSQDFDTLRIEDSTTNVLQYYIKQGEELWLTDKTKADSVIKKGFLLIDRQTISDSVLGNAYHLLGKLLVDKKENEAGVDTLLKCIEINKRAFGDSSPNLSKTYNYLGIGYYQMNEYENATIYYTEAISILKDNRIINQDLYDAYLNLGILNAAFGKYHQGYVFFDSALLVLNSLEPSIDSLRIARLYSNYGVLATLNGKLKEANKYFDIAETIYLNRYGANYTSLAGINTNKGVNTMYNNNFSQAILFYKNALEINLYNERFKYRVPMSYANLAAAAFELKDYNSSVNYCHEGLNYNPPNDVQILLLQTLAQSLSILDRKEEANSYYLKALQLIKLVKINPERSISLNKNYADLLLNNKQLTKGKIYYDFALKQSLTYYGPNSEEYAQVLSRLGVYYSDFNYNYDSSLNYYNKSISIWNNLLLLSQDTVLLENINEIRFIDSYRGKANLLYKSYLQSSDPELLNESANLYEILLDRVDFISKNLDKENSFILSAKIKPIYESAIEISYEKYLTNNDFLAFEKAFEYAERSKSSVLLSSIQNNSALKTAEVPDEVVTQDEQLQSEINGLRKLLSDEERSSYKNQKKISFFNSRLLELMIAHDSLVDEIEKNHPKYYALKYDHSVTDINTVKDNLNENELILEYVLTDTSLFIFTIGKESQELVKVPLDSIFYSSLSYLINIKNVDLTNQHGNEFKKYIASSQHLWDYLITPVYEELPGKNLIIIPDGLLGYLSFDLLINPSIDLPSGLDYKHLAYLLKEFPISYAYSSSLKYNTYFNREVNANKNLVGFSPIYATHDSTSPIDNTNGLSPLKGAEDEVLDAKSIFGGEAYLNDKASKINFLKNASDYKIIHLAMHTLINDSLPMFSELVFTNVGLDSTDYKLRTYEIFGLNLNADMVTLSACNTGSGKLQHGEGIISLSRGFVYAGVPSIVMTLWDVQDNSSSEIMKNYYTFLDEGFTKDIALQKAKINFLNNANMLKAHPYYWSAYIVTGDSSPIMLNRDHNWLELFTGLGMLLLVTLLIILKAKSAKTI